MTEIEDYAILYRRMNPDLLKPEVQALVNDVNMKAESSGWTLWLRQVLILKDAWYLLIEVEPDNDLEGFIWHLSFDLSNMKVINGNIDYNKTKYRKDRLSLIRLIPPLNNELRNINLKCRSISLEDVKTELGQKIAMICSITIEENIRRIQEEINNLDLDIKVTQENLLPIVLELNSTRTVEYIESKFRETTIGGKWDFSMEIDNLKKEEYGIITCSIDKELKYKDKILKCIGLTFYPQSFSIRILGPMDLSAYEFYYENDKKEQIPSRFMEFKQIDNGMMLTWYFQCVPDSKEPEEIIKRIRIKYLPDLPGYHIDYLD